MEDSNTELSPVEEVVDCPPSVSPELWAKVPQSRRREALERAAKGLRKGVHPEISITDFVVGLKTGV